MKALKNLSLLLLLVLAFTGCHNKSSKLADFNRTVYTPEYASGFDIKGADGKKSVLVTVTNPWQGADSITTNLFIARDDEEVPADFTGQMLKGDAERIVCMWSAFRDSTISPIPTFRHGGTALEMWATKGTSITNCCSRLTPTSCCFTA